MTQEEKAQAYDKAIKIAKEINNEHKAQPFNVMTRVFPELKESEDDRIKETLIKYFKERQKDGDWDELFCGLSYNDIIAWLENQSMPQIRTGLEWVNTIDDACDKRYLEEYAHGEYCHEQSFKWGFQEGVEWLEKQGENK